MAQRPSSHQTDFPIGLTVYLSPCSSTIVPIFLFASSSGLGADLCMYRTPCLRAFRRDITSDLLVKSRRHFGLELANRSHRLLRAPRTWAPQGSCALRINSPVIRDDLISTLNETLAGTGAGQPHLRASWPFRASRLENPIACGIWVSQLAASEHRLRSIQHKRSSCQGFIGFYVPVILALTVSLKHTFTWHSTRTHITHSNLRQPYSDAKR